MIERLLSVVAILVLVGFLGILLTAVTRIDLSVVIALTVLLAAWDVWYTHRGDGS